VDGRGGGVRKGSPNTIVVVMVIREKGAMLAALLYHTTIYTSQGESYRRLLMATVPSLEIW